jgi:hypothetical protein
MTLHFSNRLARLLVIAAALTAVAAPAALAQPDTWYANAVAKTQPSSGTTFITDTLARGGNSTQLGTTFITDTLAPGSGTKTASSPAQPVGNGGLDWGILGIAAGGALALLLGLYSGLRIRSHHRPATV